MCVLTGRRRLDREEKYVQVAILASALLALHRCRDRRNHPICPLNKNYRLNRDDYGNYWDGGRWRDRDYWHSHYEWRKIAGGAMTAAIIAAGISVKRMNAVIRKAGAIATSSRAGRGHKHHH